MKAQDLTVGEGQSVQKYKILSLNTNGIRAAIAKNLQRFVLELNPEIICIYETKIGDKTIGKTLQEMKEGQQFARIFQLYHYVFAASSARQGYSGTAIFVKKTVRCVAFGTKLPYLSEKSLTNSEGRCTYLELPYFILLNCYVPNSGRGGQGNSPAFLSERLDWEDEIRFAIAKMQYQKPVVYCGDLNVVRSKLDIYNWEANLNAPGMAEEERKALEKLLTSCNMFDSFRDLHADQRKYSWFSNFGQDRSKNLGWRIDYFLVDERLRSNVKESDVLMQYKSFSDHTPVVLALDFGLQ